jgi:hypothetical protein
MAVTWFFTVGCASLRSRHIALLRLPCIIAARTSILYPAFWAPFSHRLHGSEVGRGAEPRGCFLRLITISRGGWDDRVPKAISTASFPAAPSIESREANLGRVCDHATRSFTSCQRGCRRNKTWGKDGEIRRAEPRRSQMLQTEWRDLQPRHEEVEHSFRRGHLDAQIGYPSPMHWPRHRDFTGRDEDA